MNKINFENLPSTNTPLSAENLNLLQDNVEEEIQEVASGDLVVDSIKSKNLFSGFLSGAYNSTTGVFDTSTSGIATPKINVENEETYYLSGTQSGIVIRVLFWNNGTFISSTTLTPTSDGIAITMAGNQFAFQTANTNQYSNVQLEKGNTKTDYRPFENLDGQELYSGIETRIGTWIDGKPLYRRVINDTLGTTNAGWKTIQLTSSNYIKKVISITAMFEYSNGNDYSIPFFRGTDDNYANREYCLCNIVPSAGTFNIIARHPNNYGLMSEQPFVATILYTKTTD